MRALEDVWTRGTLPEGAIFVFVIGAIILGGWHGAVPARGMRGGMMW